MEMFGVGRRDIDDEEVRVVFIWENDGVLILWFMVLSLVGEFGIIDGF